MIRTHHTRHTRWVDCVARTIVMLSRSLESWTSVPQRRFTLPFARPLSRLTPNVCLHDIGIFAGSVFRACTAGMCRNVGGPSRGHAAILAVQSRQNEPTSLACQAHASSVVFSKR